MSIENEKFIQLINDIKAGTSINQEQFLSAFSTSSMHQDASGRFSHSEEYIKLAIELIEIVNQKFSNIIDVSAIYSLDISIVKLIAERGVIDNHTMLKIALKVSNYEDDYLTYALPIQTNIIKSCLTKGISLKDFSINELNIIKIHFSILNLLTEEGLHPNALEIRQIHESKNTKNLELAIDNNLKLSPFSLIYCLFNEDISTDFLKSLIDNIEIQINDSLSLDAIESSVMFNGANFKEFINTNIFAEYEKTLFSDHGTLLHLLVKLNKYELLEFVLKNYDIDINVRNDFDQTPLFFVKDYLIAELLINHQADLNVTDQNGFTWLNKLPLSMLEYAVKNGFVTKDYAFKSMRQHLQKGDFEYAAKLTKLFDFKLDLNPVDELVESIIVGLANSVEKNKYQALISLINKAGIKIPTESEYLLSSYADEHKLEEFQFVDGLIHKLAKHYINLAKVDYTESSDNDKFNEYFKIFGKASIILDNDFMLEALTINGLRPNKLDKDVLVYRGIATILSPYDVDAYFKYGHRAFSVGENQKTLGFYVNEAWNELGANWLRWEFGGTYTALQPYAAAGFAVGQSSIGTVTKKGTLIEIKLPGDAPKICGGWQTGWVMS